MKIVENQYDGKLAYTASAGGNKAAAEPNCRNGKAKNHTDHSMAMAAAATTMKNPLRNENQTIFQKIRRNIWHLKKKFTEKQGNFCVYSNFLVSIVIKNSIIWQNNVGKNCDLIYLSPNIQTRAHQ